MKRIILSAVAAILASGIAVPASACLTAQHQVTIYPVIETKPKAGEGGLGSVFKIRYAGERSGEINKLWPNYYVVEVLSGKMKGKKVAIPAHVTSCHSVHITEGAEGYVVGSLRTHDRDGKAYDMPILATMMNGRKEKFGIVR